MSRDIPVELKELIIEACSSSKSMKEASSKTKLHFNTFKKYAVLLGVYSTNQSGAGIPKKRPSIPLSEILEGLHPQYNVNRLRIRLIREGILKERCSSCGRITWLGKPIPLELDHINGDSYDHILSNLRLLCPNCHSLTDTYRGKNIRRPT